MIMRVRNIFESIKPFTNTHFHDKEINGNTLHVKNLSFFERNNFVYI